MAMERKLIRGCTLINRGKRHEGASILVEGDRIAQVFERGAELPTGEDIEIIEADGKLAMPGVIDDQVHFREPGLTHKGDIATESRAALLGGVTSFMEMPNTIPQTTTLEAWVDKMARGAVRSWGNYSFYFGATNDNAAELRRMDRRQIPGVKVFMGSSTGNMLVDREESLRQIFSEAGTIVATHCEEESIIQQNKAHYIELEGTDPAVVWHPYIRSREACIRSSEKAIALAEELGTELHILHLSTKEEVELIRAASPHITAEICVHHLWFTSEDYPRLGTRIKWNPAIKELADREALRCAVRDGVVNVVATDHAPHTLAEKEGGALRAASGGPLAQHSLLMMLELAREGCWSPERVVEVMCHGPAERFRVIDRGYIEAGAYADILLVEATDPWQVTADSLESKCGWSPLEGATFHHRISEVLLNGRVVIRGGELQLRKEGQAMPLRFDR